MPALTSRRRFLTTTAAAASTLLGRPRTLSGQPRQRLGDVVVLVPGIMGSVLRKDDRDVWALSGSAILNGLRTLGGSVKDLTLSGDSPDRADLGDGIVASAVFPDTHLLPGFWKIDGYTATTQAIARTYHVANGRNYFEFPYDWRRDNRVAARRLATLAGGWLRTWRQGSGNSGAKLILVAHSMGGLVCRYFLEVLGGWRDTRMLITFGTPYRGSLNALGFLANGMKKSIGPFTLVDVSGLLRSFTSVYQLLPIYPCYDGGGGTLQRVSEAAGIPNVDAGRARAALDFHNEIRSAAEANARDPAYLTGRYTLHPIVGTYQPTLQIGKRSQGGVEMLERHPRAQVQGDGTVPETSATPVEPDALTKQHRTVYVSEVHGSLQNSKPMLDHVLRVFTEGGVPGADFRAATKSVALSVEDVYATGERIRVRAGCEDARAELSAVTVDAATGAEVARTVLRLAGTGLETFELQPLPEGTYRLEVRGTGEGIGSARDVFIVVRA